MANRTGFQTIQKSARAGLPAQEDRRQRQSMAIREADAGTADRKGRFPAAFFFPLARIAIGPR